MLVVCWAQVWSCSTQCSLLWGMNMLWNDFRSLEERFKAIMTTGDTFECKRTRKLTFWRQSDTPLSLFLYENEGKKGRNHISHGWMYYIQRDEEKDDSISPDSCYNCSSHLQTAPILQQPPATSSTGLLQFIRESTNPAVTSGQQFCPRDTHLPPMHIFLDEISLKRENMKQRFLNLST